jgi:hypothetical protein
MNREERKYFYEKLRELFAEWVNDANTDIKSHIYDMITSFEERYMTNVTGQQPFPQELFRVFLEEHALVHKLQQRGAFKVVNELPTDDIDIYSIYLLRKGATTEEYIYYNEEWVYLGNNDVDLSIFYNKTETDEKLNDKAATKDLSSLNEYVVNADNQQKEVSARLETEIAEANSRITKNENNTIATINQLQAQISSLRVENAEQQADLVAAQKKVQTLEADNSALRKELAEVKQLTYAAL